MFATPHRPIHVLPFAPFLFSIFIVPSVHSVLLVPLVSPIHQMFHVHRVFQSTLLLPVVAPKLAYRCEHVLSWIHRTQQAEARQSNGQLAYQRPSLLALLWQFFCSQKMHALNKSLTWYHSDGSNEAPPIPQYGRCLCWLLNVWIWLYQ